MTFKKSQKITLSDLDKASKEYELLLEQTERTYEKWNVQKDASFASIAEVESLVSSISHAPVKISRKLKKLTAHKEDYKNRETIEREKRKKDLAVGAGALAVLSTGAVAAVSFGSIL